ncbi:MAG TPA: T9SS type A sorting domain-containing protein [Ignavibacteria bacterium]|nr:T9SS type A sorting domain-containing protein [Ignavibacteria bacterium]HMQ98118.1 T9SS type A sorting domain-containing protein [Ignavibacteria bacterium]
MIALILLLAARIFGQVYSTIDYGNGTLIDIDAGADVCANDIFINGTYSGTGTICTGALPVSLSSFTSSVEKNNVKLNWVTEWELNNLGFDLERKESKEGSSWGKIAFITGGGTTQGQKFYSYEEKKLKAGSYNYRLKQIDYNGNYEYYDLGETVVIKAPNDYVLSQNYPNPSNPKCKIDYEIPFEGKVSLKVYDILGKEVFTLIDEFKSADFYSIEFDGSNLASGMYFYRIMAEGGGKHFTKTMKMVLVK